MRLQAGESASSSMHSWPIMVESMSARKSFLRLAICRLHHNVDRQVASRRAQAVGDGADVLGCREGNVDGDFVEQPLRRTGEGRTARAPSTMVESSAGLAGLHISVATRDMT